MTTNSKNTKKKTEQFADDEKFDKKDKAYGVLSENGRKKLNKIVSVASKVIEIVHFVGAGFMIVLSIAAIFNIGNWQKMVEMDGRTEIKAYGLEMNIMDNGELNPTSFILFGFGSAIVMILMAMVFRNIYLITEQARKKGTPFTPDNVRMLKEIGVFCILSPVISNLFSIVAYLITGHDIDFNAGSVIVGLIVLYLTQFFAHGVELEEDVKDLV